MAKKTKKKHLKKQVKVFMAGASSALLLTVCGITANALMTTSEHKEHNEDASDVWDGKTPIITKLDRNYSVENKGDAVEEPTPEQIQDDAEEHITYALAEVGEVHEIQQPVLASARAELPPVIKQISVQTQPQLQSENADYAQPEQTWTNPSTEETWVDPALQEYLAYQQQQEYQEPVYQEQPAYTGAVLTARMGTIQGPSGKETYYNLPMSGVLNIMRGIGNQDGYWVRDDGVKMLGDYVMVAANLDIHPRGSLVETSLGTGIVCDTGTFIYSNPYQIDVATTW